MGHVSHLNLIQAASTIGVLLGVSGCSILVNGLASPPSEDVEVQSQTAVAEVGAEATAPSAESKLPEDSSASTNTAPQRDFFREGINRASSAVAIGQTAQSQEDWALAASRWQQAIDLLEQVPGVDPSHAQAQAKIQEYRSHLASTQQRAEGRPNPTTQPTQLRSDGLVAQIPIQERRGGTPVVSVTMKGQKGTSTFPMLFDTGATGTLITQDMANALGVVIVGQTEAKIADGSVVSLPVGYMTSIEVGGLAKAGVLVAIGGSVGLLGQDFYGEYGIAMGSHVINLHQ